MPVSVSVQGLLVVEALVAHVTSKKKKEKTGKACLLRLLQTN
jgi:hypothetical protein